MVQMHHAALTFALGRGAYKEFLGNLNFRWSQLFADLVALRPGENVAPFTTTISPILTACFAKRPRPLIGLLRFSVFGKK